MSSPHATSLSFVSSDDYDHVQTQYRAADSLYKTTLQRNAQLENQNKTLVTENNNLEDANRAQAKTIRDMDMRISGLETARDAERKERLAVTQDLLDVRRDLEHQKGLARKARAGKRELERHLWEDPGGLTEYRSKVRRLENEAAQKNAYLEWADRLNEIQQEVASFHIGSKTKHHLWTHAVVRDFCDALADPSDPSKGFPQLVSFTLAPVLEVDGVDMPDRIKDLESMYQQIQFPAGVHKSPKLYWDLIMSQM